MCGLAGSANRRSMHRAVGPDHQMMALRNLAYPLDRACTEQAPTGGPGSRAGCPRRHGAPMTGSSALISEANANTLLFA